jgi:ATP-binding protein involved in chromosome partitioning
MKVAVPTANGMMCPHFGHCEVFTLFDIDEENKQIIGTEQLNPPAHEPGALPRWLAERGVNMIIAGGMGMRAQQFFQQYNISVLVGAVEMKPETLVQDYLNGNLKLGGNICDH